MNTELQNLIAIEDATMTFIKKVQEKVNTYYATYFDNLTAPLLTMQKATRFYKIWNYEEVAKGQGVYRKGSIYGFVDKKTGEIFKAATRNAPAKHARGNVLSKYNGLEALCEDSTSIRYHNSPSLVG